MKKKYIITSILALLILAGGGVFITRYQIITFTYTTPDMTAILTKEGQKVTDIKEGRPTLLQNGTYTAVPLDKKYSQDGISIKTSNDTREVSLNFSFSEEYLRSLLTDEAQSKINQTILKEYSSKMTNFNLHNGILLGQGEWYATTITKKVGDESQTPDTYRLILKKEDAVWNIKSTPSLIISKLQHKDIPENIIDAANDL